MEYCSQIEIGTENNSRIINSKTIFNARMNPVSKFAWSLEIAVSNGKRMPKDITTAQNLCIYKFIYFNHSACKADYRMVLKISDLNFQKHAATFIDETI